MDIQRIKQELVYKAIRSGGAGGQHVNKVSTKVQLLFDLKNSNALRDEEKERLLVKLNNQLSKTGVLQLSADDSRSQLKNKTVVTQRFIDLIVSSLKVPKKRKPTKPSKSSIEKRLKEKKKASQKKSNREKPDRTH